MLVISPNPSLQIECISPGEKQMCFIESLNSETGKDLRVYIRLYGHRVQPSAPRRNAMHLDLTCPYCLFFFKVLFQGWISGVFMCLTATFILSCHIMCMQLTSSLFNVQYLMANHKSSLRAWPIGEGNHIFSSIVKHVPTVVI